MKARKRSLANIHRWSNMFKRLGIEDRHKRPPHDQLRICYQAGGKLGKGEFLTKKPVLKKYMDIACQKLISGEKERESWILKQIPRSEQIRADEIIRAIAMEKNEIPPSLASRNAMNTDNQD
ncbi:conserved hypothetical protein [Ricinus communis]|uniref:Uncharacterized protein n=1 Tax=Ricinus communis TaxID=3988 RepID=B9ST71_RICCO|nr:conserved hypothetical protein [Ricinus communis]